MPAFQKASYFLKSISFDKHKQKVCAYFFILVVFTIPFLQPAVIDNLIVKKQYN
jgi:hypothetical protein